MVFVYLGLNYAFMKTVHSPNRTYQRSIVLFFWMLISFSGTSQESSWIDSLFSKEATFSEIKQAFEAEWAGKEYVKGHGLKQFRRWEAFWETRLMPDGSFPDFKQAFNEFKQYMSVSGQAKSGQNAGNWSPMGPFNYTNTDSWSPGIGRVNFIMEDPNNANIIYIGAPAGGIWKSINAGTTWTPLGDSLAVMGISAIGISAANSNVIYLATGDADGGDTYSIGVMKSVDGGLTWNEVGNLTGNLRDVIVDPTNENIAYVASNGGVYKTIDGGTTWTQVLSGSYRDLEMKPGTPGTIYAATSNQVRYSTNFGSTWTLATGLPTGGDRMAMAVSPANSAYVYVLAANSTGAYQGIYRSTNSGVSFTARNTTTDVFDGSTQSWYDMAIGVSSTDANMVFTGCLNVWKSTNGGTSLTALNSWSNPAGASYTHADIHFLRGVNGKIYCGSDGGVYRSTNNGTNFTDLTVGIQIGQFYRIGGSKNDATTIAGGLQDNGGYVYNNSSWKVYYGADGMEAAISPTNSNLIYGMIQNGNLYRSTNGGNSNTSLGRPEAGRWITPMQFDPNANRIVAGYNDLHEYNGTAWNQLSTYNFPELLRNIEFFDGNSNTIFVSTDALIYKTVNNGAGFFNITNNLTSILAGNVITSIEVDPQDVNRIWVSIGGYTAGVKVAYTSNGGTTWTNVSGTLPNLPCNVVKYESSAAVSNSLYVGMDIGVYFRDDALGDFIPFMVNLPNVIVTDLELNETAGLVRAGTYGRGVWESGSYSVSAVPDDAGIADVLHPRGSLCGESFTPEVTLRNFGTNALTAVNIHYQVGNGPVNTLNWTGNLASWVSENVTLPTMTASGTNTFKSWTSQPNGIADINADNDTTAQSFTTIVNGTLVYTQIIQDCWGSEISWDILNASNATVFSGGPYSDGNGQLMMLDSVCLNSSACYNFVMDDSYGDGMSGASYASCGADGDYYVITEFGDTLVQMGVANYGFQAIHNFCVPAVATANFSWTAGNICPNQTVTFSDASSGATSWEWDFGADATPATAVGAGPHNVSYSTGGTKTALLTINGGTNVSTQTVTVGNAPSAPIITPSGPLTFCAGNSVTLTSSQALGNVWSNTATTNAINVTSSGNYSLVYTNPSGCSASSNPIAVTVNPLPSAPVITPSGSTTFCAGNSITLTSSQPIGNTWSTTSTSSSINVAASGNYTVTYTNTNGCQASSAPISVTVNPQPTISIGSLTNPSACATATGSFGVNGSGTGTVSWSGTTSGSASGVTLPYTTPGLPAGLYNVVFTNAAGCASANQSATLNDPTPPPTPTISASGLATFCLGGSVQLTSSATSGNVWTNSSSGTSITVTTSGTYGVTVTQAGCSASSLPFTVVVNPIPATPSITVNGATSLCPGQSVELISSYGSGNEWSNLQTSQTIVVNSSGTFDVTYTDANGCTSTSSGVSIVMNPTPATPIISSNGGTSLCQGETVVLTSSQGTGIVWSTMATSPSISVNTAGVFDVTYTDANGCTSVSLPTTVVVNPLPIVDAGADDVICLGDGISLSGSGASTYAWDNGVIDGQVFTPGLGTLTYQVIGTDANGCSGSDQVEVSVLPLPIVDLVAIDTTCVDAGNVTLSGSPAGGTYSGPGVSGDQFDPNSAGEGIFDILYSFTDANGCQGTATHTINVQSCSAIHENELESVNVYPNPTNGEFTIQLEGEFEFEVHDARGRVVQRGEGMNTTQMDLTEMEVGVYFLHITNNIGQKVVRVVKN